MSSEHEPKVVEAQEFLVRDKNGKIRAALGILTSWGEPVLSLHDEKGIPRVYIELMDGHPALRFMRADGNPLFSFGRTENGSPILGISRNNATPALLIIAEDGMDVKVGVCRSDGEPVWLRIADSAEIAPSDGEKEGEEGGKEEGDKSSH